MEGFEKKESSLCINIANEDDIYDINLCAKEFLDLIDNFQERFKKKSFFILTAHYNRVLAGILIADNKNSVIDSLENLLPRTNLLLLYVNPRYRKKKIGISLLETFLKMQKEKGIASVCIKLPQKYQDGIKFFTKHGFQMMERKEGKIVLEKKIWKDYGIIDCQIMDNFNDMFN